MFKDAKAFTSFSVNDLAHARDFYGTTLGVKISESMEGVGLELAGGGRVFIYPKSDHQPATFTILNFGVDNIEAAVDELKQRGIRLESYTGEIKTDDLGIFRGRQLGHGPDIAWFKDPAGNILSIFEE
jgi:predicted enzyme related to lactoylglutathione lyase